MHFHFYPRNVQMYTKTTKNTGESYAIISGQLGIGTLLGKNRASRVAQSASVWKAKLSLWETTFIFSDLHQGVN